jgi:DICT domain-containing protein
MALTTENPAAYLTTAQLAARTGVPAGTLRMWEARHGFPEPVRLSGGHRRYRERDADRVRGVLRLREQGLSLPAAIERSRTPASAPASIFAGLRDRRADLQPSVIPKRALLRLTWAIEDEYCARASTGVLIASFQRAEFYRRARPRWRELARTAELAIALADFRRLRQPPRGPVEVPVAREEPLAREWTLIVDAPGMQACLAGWERPAARALPDAERRFEVLWSFEPSEVQTATAIAAEQIRMLAPALADRLPVEGETAPAGDSPELRSAAGLANRVVDYLGAVSPTA